MRAKRAKKKGAKTRRRRPFCTRRNSSLFITVTSVPALPSLLADTESNFLHKSFPSASAGLLSKYLPSALSPYKGPPRLHNYLFSTLKARALAPCSCLVQTIALECILRTRIMPSRDYGLEIYLCDRKARSVDNARRYSSSRLDRDDATAASYFGWKICCQLSPVSAKRKISHQIFHYCPAGRRLIALNVISIIAAQRRQRRSLRHCHLRWSAADETATLATTLRPGHVGQ
jgi:hypothetical protein